MKIITLIENTSQQEWPVEHGLSLYIETEKQRILFDMGQTHLFAENAARKGIDLSLVDLAILSHGHYDHGGGLKTFLEINTKAPVYLHQKAFEAHYSQRIDGMYYIGLDSSLKNNPRLHFCNENTYINPNLQLFTQNNGNCLCPPGNQMLFGPTPQEHDSFCHELNLLIKEGSVNVLVAGCAHTGIVNILQKANNLSNHLITHVLAGMHLAKNGLNPKAEAIFIKDLACHLLEFTDCHFYTMHCTGLKAYKQLKEHMKERIDYLSAGDEICLS